MQSRLLTDDLVMTLVEQALERPESDREAYLRSACGSNDELFSEALNYVKWERRMQGFLVDPLAPPIESDIPFQPDQAVINRFRIIREVAQGGMGIVWEAMDEKLDRRVALKCAKAGFGKQLPPEVRNAREVSHPNVCKIFEIHTAQTLHGEIDFISMEFLDGETLAERLRNGPIPEPEARIIARQLCAGLTEAHRCQLIHGDLKPNNVILTKNGEGLLRAVITDFGLARRADAAAGVLGGTPAYMAPELWKGARPSVASDIYALGVLLWELRYGLPPGDLGLQSSTLLVGEHSCWKPPPGRGRWDRIIARCLDPIPLRRFRSVAAVAERFGASRIVKWALAMAATVTLVAGSGWITYQRTAASVEQVKLALLPFTSEPVSAAQGLIQSTERQLAELKSTPKTRFRFISLDSAIRRRVHTPDEARALLGATHALRASIEKHGDEMNVHGYLTDLRSGVDIRQWNENYKPEEMRYVPVGLAGMVTNALHLPPPTAGSTVNAAARADYVAGLAALRRDKTIDEALRRLESAVKCDSNSALTFAALAEAQWFKYALTNDKTWLERSAASVRLAKLRNFDLALLHSISGLLRNREGRYELAVADYLRAIELDPSGADAYRRLGETYLRNEQGEEALAAFRKAIELDSKQHRNYRDLGDFFLQRGRYKEAIFQFKNALSIAPGEPLAKHHLGMAYMNDGQFAFAESELQEFIATKEVPSALHTLGLVRMYQSRDRDAIPMIKRALVLGPERAEWWMDLGVAYRRAGLISDSAQAFHRGIDLAESKLITNPREGLLRSYLGYLCAEIGDIQRAQTEIAQALQGAPNDADVRWMAAWTYETLGQRGGALSILANVPTGVLADLNRWPDLADLQKDSRFKELLAAKGDKN